MEIELEEDFDCHTAQSNVAAVALWDNILYNMERPGVDRLMGTWCLGIVLACWRDDVCTAHLMRIINDKCWWCYCIQASIIGIVNTQHGVYLPNAYTTDFYPACVEFKKKVQMSEVNIFVQQARYILLLFALWSKYWGTIKCCLFTYDILVEYQNTIEIYNDFSFLYFLWLTV